MTQDLARVRVVERDVIHRLRPDMLAAGWEWCIPHQNWDACHTGGVETPTMDEWGPR